MGAGDELDAILGKMSAEKEAAPVRGIRRIHQFERSVFDNGKKTPKGISTLKKF